MLAGSVTGVTVAIVVAESEHQPGILARGGGLGLAVIGSASWCAKGPARQAGPTASKCNRQNAAILPPANFTSAKNLPNLAWFRKVLRMPAMPDIPSMTPVAEADAHKE